MTGIEIAFKLVAILHGVFGYIFFIFAMDEGVQCTIFYDRVNPLVGDINKYLVYFSYGALAICGSISFYSNGVSVIFCWISLAILFFCYMLLRIISGDWSKPTGKTVAHYALRVGAAFVLTALYFASSS